MRSTLLVVVAVAAAAMIAAPAALANGGFTLHGGATAKAGHVELVSNLADATTTNDASWIDFRVPSKLTFAGLKSLSTKFNVTDDGCGGGSPRFQINVGGKNVFVYLGPAPTFTGCALNTWLSSGNLVGTSDPCRVDTSQLAPGTQCSTWAAAVALLGSQRVTGIQLVTDGGWFFADKEQTVLVRKVVINHRTYVTHKHPKPKVGPPKHKVGPAWYCTEQRHALGWKAFEALWGKRWKAHHDAFGRCVATMAKAQRDDWAEDLHEEIMEAIRECRSEGYRGVRLAACVADEVGLEVADPKGKHGKKGKKDKDD